VSLSLNTFVDPYENEQQKNEDEDEGFIHTEDKIFGHDRTCDNSINEAPSRTATSNPTSSPPTRPPPYERT